MKLVVGLGNPGAQYETTRHNVGFLAADRLIDAWKAERTGGSNSGEVYRADVRGERVLIVKPQTFMNLSGQCVGPIMQFHKLAPSDLVVIHDELDLGPLTFKLKTGGGTGGHNGLKSIDAALGAGKLDYHRVRIGIGHPRELGLPQEPVDYVLGRYTKAELSGLDAVLDRVRLAVERIVSGDMRGAMTEFNAKAKE